MVCELTGSRIGMEHKWLGIGLLAMGMAGLIMLLGKGQGGGGLTERKGDDAGSLAVAGTAVPGDVRLLPWAVGEGGMEVYGALAERRSSRNFAAEAEIPDEVLGQVLWAAAGINRRDGRLTVPTALNKRDLRVFVLDARGVWLYLPKDHALRCQRAGDWRRCSGKQGFAADAAVDLVYAVDLSAWKGRGAPEEDIVRNGMFEAGCAAQNVALACVSEGLKNVVRGSWPVEELAEAVRLPENWRILITQSVGP